MTAHEWIRARFREANMLLSVSVLLLVSALFAALIAVLVLIVHLSGKLPGRVYVHLRHRLLGSMIVKVRRLPPERSQREIPSTPTRVKPELPVAASPSLDIDEETPHTDTPRARRAAMLPKHKRRVR
jgi:hypothetical protein